MSAASDAQEMEVKKHILMRQIEEYKDSHPELKELMQNFLVQTFLDKPADIHAFARSYFQPLLRPKPGIVFSGPSGVGKGTIIEKVMESFPSAFGFSVSHTSRGARPGEEDGTHYHFRSKAEIQSQIDAGGFLEHAEVHGSIYGTSVQSYESVVSTGRICVLDIDVQGFKQLRSNPRLSVPPHSVFVTAPSEVIERRLRSRGTETEDAIQRRLANAAAEVSFGTAEGSFEFVLENDDLEVAVAQLKTKLFEWYPHLLALQ